MLFLILTFHHVYHPPYLLLSSPPFPLTTIFRKLRASRYLCQLRSNRSLILHWWINQVPASYGQGKSGRCCLCWVAGNSIGSIWHAGSCSSAGASKTQAAILFTFYPILQMNQSSYYDPNFNTLYQYHLITVQPHVHSTQSSWSLSSGPY